MNKTETKTKIPDRGMFYYQKKCFSCGKLIWGSSPKNHRQASKDCYFKMKTHHQEKHPLGVSTDTLKESKQLDLSIPGREKKQTETISRVTLKSNSENLKKQ